MGTPSYRGTGRKTARDPRAPIETPDAVAELNRRGPVASRRGTSSIEPPAPLALVPFASRSSTMSDWKPACVGADDPVRQHHRQQIDAGALSRGIRRRSTINVA